MWIELTPFSWREFYRAWECACVDAWEADEQEPTATLPLNVFPDVTGVLNPLTGHVIPIVRVPPFAWDTSRCACSADTRYSSTVD